MKQYTTPEQTAKLAELGFNKPRECQTYTMRDDRGVEYGVLYGGYSIGELIEMLGVHMSSIYYIGIVWAVNATGIQIRSEELIDALYDMIVKLKEEGII